MDWTDRRERLRAVIAGPRCIYPGSVFDPISARIAEDLGFEAGMFAGSIASFAVLGAPDIIVLTLTEFAQQAYRINRAGKLPLLVDADHGYGNALNVKRTVEELETAGVAALTIEDTALPTPYGATAATLIPIAEGVGKMKAALAGRQDKRLVIVGRTSAMAMTGVEDTIARLKAYEDAGVDMLFLVGVKTRAQLDAVAAAVKLPLFLGGAGAELYDLDYLSARAMSASACKATCRSWRRSTPCTKRSRRCATARRRPSSRASRHRELMKQVTRQADYAKWSKEFLNAGLS